MKNPFKIERPYCLSLEDWDKWHAQAKKEYPIRYFLSDTLSNFFQRKIFKKIHEFIYFIKCHTLSSHKFHLLDLRQPKQGDYNSYRYGWMDRSELILFACMNLLCEFIEKEHHGVVGFKQYIEFCKENDGENPNTPFNNSENIIANQELLEIYWWWRTDRKLRWDKVDELLMDVERNWKSANDLEQQLISEDTEKLKRLIELRGWMWT